jgi:hypothetical protein
MARKRIHSYTSLMPGLRVPRELSGLELSLDWIYLDSNYLDSDYLNFWIV